MGKIQGMSKAAKPPAIPAKNIAHNEISFCVPAFAFFTVTWALGLAVSGVEVLNSTPVVETVSCAFTALQANSKLKKKKTADKRLILYDNMTIYSLI
jgi:hypothetical protein